MFRISRLTVLAAVAAVFVFQPKGMPAHANTGSSVGGPTVDAGKTVLEYRLAGSLDNDNAGEDERVRTRVHLDHAFNDIYAARLVFSLDRRKHDGFEAEALSWQNRFHLLKAEDVGFDGGIRLNYTLPDGDKEPDVISLRFYQQIPLRGFEIRFNQIFEHETGDASNPGVIAEWRSQVTYPVAESLRLGLDLFHDFGNLRDQDGYDAQAHAAGPVLKAKFGEGYALEAAWRAGLSEGAPDQSLTFILSRAW